MVPLGRAKGSTRLGGVLVATAMKDIPSTAQRAPRQWLSNPGAQRQATSAPSRRLSASNAEKPREGEQTEGSVQSLPIGRLDYSAERPRWWARQLDRRLSRWQMARAIRRGSGARSGKRSAMGCFITVIDCTVSSCELDEKEGCKLPTRRESCIVARLIPDSEPPHGQLHEAWPSVGRYPSGR